MKIHHASIKKAAKFHITMLLEDNEVVATAKDGTRLASGLQGNKVLEDAITKQTGKPAKGNGVKKPERLVFKPVAKKARKTAKRLIGSAIDAEDGDEATDELELAEDDSDADQSKSIVKSKYKTLYKPHKDRCGDDLSNQINKHVSRENDAGEMRVDLNALRNFAKANDCWVPSYASLTNRSGGWNAGQARMNVGNRLRAKIRQAIKVDKEYRIKWV